MRPSAPQAGALPLGARIEIACTASVGGVPKVSGVGKSAVPVYSGAYALGDVLYVSGQVAIDRDSADKTLVGAGDIAKEAEQSLKNLEAALVEGGSALSKVLKCVCYLADINDYGAFNEVRTSRVCVPASPQPGGVPAKHPLLSCACLVRMAWWALMRTRNMQHLCLSRLLARRCTSNGSLSPARLVWHRPRASVSRPAHCRWAPGSRSPARQWPDRTRPC